MSLNKLLLAGCFLLFITLKGFSQNPETTKRYTQKFKPPVVKTMWGIHSDTVLISRDEALDLLAIPIRIVDQKDKKTTYAVNSYQFLYRKKGFVEDEESGKVTPVKSMVAQLFKTTPLPDVWRNSISEQLQNGEELHYFDVIVKDNQGRLFFAPELKIKIK